MVNETPVSDSDIVYVGENQDRIALFRQEFPSYRLRTLQTAEDVKNYSRDLSASFSAILEASGVPTTQAAEIFPRVILSECDVRRFPESPKPEGYGPAIILGFRDFVGRFRDNGLYLIVSDEKYDANYGGLKKVCEENQIPIVREGELAQKLSEKLS